MSVIVTRTDVVSYFLGEWTDTEVYVGNVQARPDIENTHLRIQVVANMAEQPCLGWEPGQTWERNEGDIIIGVFVPVNSADDGLAIADKARRVLSQQRLGQTILGPGYVVPSGVRDDRRFYIYNVRIEYRTDNIKEEL